MYFRSLRRRSRTHTCTSSYPTSLKMDMRIATCVLPSVAEKHLDARTTVLEQRSYRVVVAVDECTKIVYLAVNKGNILGFQHN